MKTREVAYGGISVALLTICSWISIPFVIPFTLQTFAIFLICYLFGGKRGVLYILCYIVCGAIGLPVFSGFRGGFQALFDLTGGYILGFLGSALLLWGTERFWKGKVYRFALCAFLALLICYGFGTIWFLFVSMQKQNMITVGSVLMVCVIPFVIPDLLKIALACLLGDRIKRFRQQEVHAE